MTKWGGLDERIAGAGYRVITLEKLAVPALVMHGRYDPLIPVDFGRDLAGLIPGARLVEYDGGHNLGNDDTVRRQIEAAIVEHIALHN